MTVGIEHGETKKGSRTPKINPKKHEVKVLKWLEKLTGADLIVSPFTLEELPLAKGTLREHMDGGALLVQIKNNEDLTSSAGDRLNYSLAKMLEWTPNTAQRILLPIGLYGCDSEGFALVNGRRTHFKMRFKSFQLMLSACQDGGWRVEYPLAYRSMLEWWLKSKESKLIEYKKNNIKLAFPGKVKINDYIDPDSPLRIPVKAPDGLTFLVNLPGIGRELGPRLWKHFKGDLGRIFEALTDLAAIKYDLGLLPPGIGMGKVRRICEMFKLIETDDQYQRLTVTLEHKDPNIINVITTKETKDMRDIITDDLQPF